MNTLIVLVHPVVCVVTAIYWVVHRKGFRGVDD